MTVCIVLGRKNRQAAKKLCRCLERHGGALLLCEEAVGEFYVYQPEYVIYAPRRGAAPLRGGALLLKWSEDTASLTLCDGGEIRIGLRENCDITASSIGTQRLSVGIQNVIPTCFGREILPCDFPVEYKEAPNIQTLLCACAVLLVTENFKISENTLSF